MVNVVNGSNPHGFSAGIRLYTESRAYYHYCGQGTHAISVGSSVTRDLRYPGTVHSLSPVLWSSDGDRADRIAEFYFPVPGQKYLRCNGKACVSQAH